MVRDSFTADTQHVDQVLFAAAPNGSPAQLAHSAPRT